MVHEDLPQLLRNALIKWTKLTHFPNHNAHVTLFIAGNKIAQGIRK